MDSLSSIVTLVLKVMSAACEKESLKPRIIKANRIRTENVMSDDLAIKEPSMLGLTGSRTLLAFGTKNLQAEPSASTRKTVRTP